MSVFGTAAPAAGFTGGFGSSSSSLATLTSASSTAPAAGLEFGETGSGAGQTKVPVGLAVSVKSGELYVADRNNNRVDVFSEDGVFVMAFGWGVDAESPKPQLQSCTAATGCLQGVASAAGGAMYRPVGVAVDNDPASPGYGDVYVGDLKNQRVDVFTEAGVFVRTFGGKVNKRTGGNVCAAGEECVAGASGSGPGEFSPFARSGTVVSVPVAGPDAGLVFVGDTGRVEVFDAAGEFEREVPVAGGQTESVTADEEGHVYVLPYGGEHVYEYEAGGPGIGTELPPIRDAAGVAASVALGEGSELFVDDQSDVGLDHHILTFASSGEQVASFDGGMEGASYGMAWSETAKVLYVINNAKKNIRVVVPPPPGPLVVGGCLHARPEPRGRATVLGCVNPESETEEVEYWVDYGATGALGLQTPHLKLKAGFEEAAVEVPLAGLSFETEYHYCLVARSGKGEDKRSCEGGGSTFVELPATVLGEEWSSEVTSSSIELHAEVNPEETETACVFEYGPAGEYERDGMLAGTVAGSAITAPGTAVVVVSGHAQTGIAAGTRYAYRVSCSKSGLIAEGPVRYVASKPAGAAGGLADRRVAELVDDGEGGAVVAPQDGVPVAAPDGSVLAYETQLPGANTSPEDNRSPETAAVVAQRTSGGWVSRAVNTPYDEFAPAQLSPEFLFYSEDIAAAVIEPRELAALCTQTRVSEGLCAQTATEWTPYLISGLSSARRTFDPLLTAGDVTPAGVDFGAPEPGVRAPLPGINVAGANPGLSDVALNAGRVALLEGTVAKSLYLWDAGRLLAVSVLPAGEGGGSVAAQLGGGEGVEEYNTRGAVSEDGRLVYWGTSGEGSDYRQYLTDTATGRSTRIDLPTPGASASGPVGARFQMATEDGRRLFFTDTQQLTPQATAAEPSIGQPEPDLYACDVTLTEAAPECKLTDITTSVQNHGETADVQGVIAGASTDGKRVFYVARGALTPDATHGQDNLYLSEETQPSVWHTTHIATLSPEDKPEWGGINRKLQLMSIRNSPNGDYLAFMSNANLTGYDNHDASSGALDEETYLYHVATGKLICTSCAPSGERPTGLYDEGVSGKVNIQLFDQVNAWQNRWVAGILPSWRGGQLDVHQPRYITNNGRLFFQSATPLTHEAPAAGTLGVYEYEPAGTGSCNTTTPQYDPTLEGCTSLLSPAASPREAVFLEASEDGNDAFIIAAHKPASNTGPDIYGLYDLHSCETNEDTACQTSNEPTSPTGECTTAAGCKTHATSTQAPIPPSSATLQGNGNQILNITPHAKTRKQVRRHRRRSKRCLKHGHPARRGHSCNQHTHKRRGRRRHNRGR